MLKFPYFHIFIVVFNTYLSYCCYCPKIYQKVVFANARKPVGNKEKRKYALEANDDCLTWCNRLEAFSKCLIVWVHTHRFCKSLFECINPFDVISLFLCPLETWENLSFSDVFRGYRKRLVVWNDFAIIRAIYADYSGFLQHVLSNSLSQIFDEIQTKILLWKRLQKCLLESVHTSFNWDRCF